MRELGYVEGHTVETEYLFADGHFDRLPDLAANLVEHKVDLIVTTSTSAIIVAKRAAEKIPIIFAASSDPISTGVVASLAHPSGNITGLSLMAADLSAKRLGLIHTLVPRVGQVAVLWDSSNPGMDLRVRETRAAAEQSRVVFFDAGARNLDELTAMFGELAKRQPLVLVVTAEPFTAEHRSRILDFVAGHAIPAMYEDGRYVEAGGLISYGPSVRDLFNRSAQLVDKILKGANPANLPVEQPTKFESIITTPPRRSASRCRTRSSCAQTSWSNSLHEAIPLGRSAVMVGPDASHLDGRYCPSRSCSNSTRSLRPRRVSFRSRVLFRAD